LSERVSTRYYSVIGLGFGDCGKGRFVDDLCAMLDAHTVVRFNGGGQAGHNVVRRDGVSHTFSHFAAASFRPGVKTVLARQVVVHPSALLVEEQHLARIGIGDALARLMIDGRCRITTPYVQAAGRLRELLRGADAHGTCGVGVGETIKLDLEAPELSLRYADLSDARRCDDLVERQRQHLLAQFSGAATNDESSNRERSVLEDRHLAAHWRLRIEKLVRTVPASEHETTRARLARPGAVIFEGAQGLLLDQDYGFHPHTTWSSTGPKAVCDVLGDLELPEDVRHFGAMRTYLTRHGAGPFPTCDAGLSHLLEPHNAEQGWQGAFRRGHPDALLLRYALQAAPEISGLLVSHLDALQFGAGLRWCTAYESPEFNTEVPWLARQMDGKISSFSPPAPDDIRGQIQRTSFLAQARPVYDRALVRSEEAWLDSIHAIAERPCVLVSTGPQRGAIRSLHDLD
jgi:adenylosuccinate synthase